MIYIVIIDQDVNLGNWSRGEEMLLSLRRSSFSASFPSKHKMLMLSKFGSDALTVLLVAIGELVTLFDRLRTLYIDDAGTFVTSGRRFPVMPRLISYTRTKPTGNVVINKHTPNATLKEENKYSLFYFFWYLN